ncbi:MAG: FAD-binding protein [Acidobacteria bacterium]|nr:MAG: FAD-binding protein [Acidobacteriota bacterium]
MTWVTELAREISGQVLTDEASRQAVATDFGRLVVRKPQAVVRPASTEDVSRLLKFAAKHQLTVATRGAGHSQTGQSLSDQIVLDVTSLDQINQQDDQGLAVVCQGGVKWRALVERLAPSALSPLVLTNNLDVTVGGTLSSAGLGVASWRFGTQADNCLELEVVTGAGEIVPCSTAQNRELFDAVRAGMGQFGVITEATLKLRRHRAKFRSYYLLYDDLNVLLGDLKLLMTEERFEYVESWCVPCPQGFRKAGGQRQPFAQWFYPLHLTAETDGTAGPDTGEKLRGLKFYRHVHTEDGEIGEFFTRLDPLFALWKQAGFWDFTHPWMECVLPWHTAPVYIGQMLQMMPPQALAGGHILLWPARGGASSLPMFVRPPGDFLIGFGILPAIPKNFVNDLLPRLNQASQASMMAGGKRYLSGWIPFAHGDWRAHFAELWPTVVKLKKQFDPSGVLNPGFVKYE